MSIEKIERLIEKLTKPHSQMHRSGHRVEKSPPSIQREAAATIRALLDELSWLREERDKYKTALTLTPMAERLAELPDFMVALSEWGCTEPSEQAASISDFLNSLVGLKQYLEETRP